MMSNEKEWVRENYNIFLVQVEIPLFEYTHTLTLAHTRSNKQHQTNNQQKKNIVKEPILSLRFTTRRRHNKTPFSWNGVLLWTKLCELIEYCSTSNNKLLGYVNGLFDHRQTPLPMKPKFIRMAEEVEDWRGKPVSDEPNTSHLAECSQFGVLYSERI